MKSTTKKLERSLLHSIYTEISKIKTSITLYMFFEYIVPPTVSEISDNATKGKYIRNKMPKCVKEYYRDRNNEKDLKYFLKDWCSFIQSDSHEILIAIIRFFKENHHTDFAFQLEKQVDESDIDIYYSIFRYCFTLEYITQDKPKDLNQIALREFNEKILMEYGVSGKSGNEIILQLANMGTSNPYILFEAAEIEYMKGYNGTGNAQENLEKAYEYYKKASSLGHALADWSLGYLANMCRKKTWHINAYANMSENEKIKTAIQYYQKAAQKGLSRAFNSLGSIVSDKSVPEELLKNLKSAEEYYQKSAQKGNYLGMYHYARTLEKKLKVLVDKQNENKNECNDMLKTGKEMLDYFIDSAKLGYSKAYYRCALYYGHLSDDKTAMNKNFHIVKQNKNTAIKYLQKAINSDECFYNAFIYLSEYILREKELFWGWENELKKAKKYIKKLDEELIKTEKASDFQKEKVEKLKRLFEKAL